MTAYEDFGIVVHIHNQGVLERPPIWLMVWMGRATGGAHITPEQARGLAAELMGAADAVDARTAAEVAT